MSKKREKQPRNPNYTSIIASKTAVKRLSDARDKWKDENKNFSQVGLIPFAIFLLEEYEKNKNERQENQG